MNPRDGSDEKKTDAKKPDQNTLSPAFQNPFFILLRSFLNDHAIAAVSQVSKQAHQRVIEQVFASPEAILMDFYTKGSDFAGKFIRRYHNDEAVLKHLLTKNNPLAYVVFAHLCNIDDLDPKRLHATQIELTRIVSENRVESVELINMINNHCLPTLYELLQLKNIVKLPDPDIQSNRSSVIDAMMQALYNLDTFYRHSTKEPMIMGYFNLGGINFSDVTIGKDFDFNQVNFHSSNFQNLKSKSKITFSQCYLDDTNFNNTNCNQLYFSATDARNVNFRKASIIEFKTDGSDFRKCNFIDTRIQHLDIKGSDLRGCIMRDFVVDNIALSKVRLDNSDLRDMNFHTNSTLDRVNFEGANLSGANFNHCKMKKCSFLPQALPLNSDSIKEFIKYCSELKMPEDNILWNIMRNINHAATLDGGDLAFLYSTETKLNLLKAAFTSFQALAGNPVISFFQPKNSPCKLIKIEIEKHEKDLILQRKPK